MADNILAFRSNDTCGSAEEVSKLKTIHERICFMYKHMLYPDVTIVVKENGSNVHPISAHKAILSIGSPVFADILKKSNETVIEINGNENAIRKVIEFLYTDEADFMDELDVMQTFLAADTLQVEHLKEVCEELLSTIALSVNSICQTLKCSTSSKLTNFTNRVRTFIEENAMQVFGSLEFTHSDKKTIKNIITLPNLSVQSEKAVFKAVMAWAAKQSPDCVQKQQWSEARTLVESLLRHIRFLSMSTAEFTECISHFPGLLTEKESLDIMMYISKPGSSDLPLWCNKCNTKRRKAQPKTSQARDEEFINLVPRLTEPTIQEFPSLDFLHSTIEINCKRNSYMLLQAMLKWKINMLYAMKFGALRYSVKVLISPSGFEYTEPVKTCGEQEVSIQFPQNIVVKKNQKLMIEVTMDNIKGFCFLSYEQPIPKDQQNDMPLSYTLSCAPKQFKFSVFDSLSFRKVNCPPKAEKKKKTSLRVAT